MVQSLIRLTTTAAVTTTQAETTPLEPAVQPSLFEKALDFVGGWPTLWILVVLVLGGIGLLLYFRRHPQQGKKLFTTRMLATGALCIALSYILSNIRLFRMPQGGSITPASLLPMLLFAYTYGFVPSLLVSLAYGLLQLLQDPWIVSPAQAMLDYVIAYMGIALCGLSRRLPETFGYIVGVCATGVWRFACAVLSGLIFFASYTPVGQLPILYSMGYNSVILIDTAICLVIMLIPQVRSAAARIARAGK